jgi:ERCC4-type nuclease
MSFQNIFSSKKDKPEQEITIQIDNRERNSLVPSELVSLGVKIQFEQLEVGDYIVKSTIIERKTVQDLKSSIINKRIHEQIKNLKQYPRSLLVIEGISEENIFWHNSRKRIKGFSSISRS